MHSVYCKVCGFDKHQLDLEQIKADRYKAMFNPAIQAKILNDANTEYDMIFDRHSTAPASTLVAKDLLLSHNPLKTI